MLQVCRELFYKEVLALPVDAVGMDFISNTGNLANIKKYGFPKDDSPARSDREFLKTPEGASLPD